MKKTSETSIKKSEKDQLQAIICKKKKVMTATVRNWAAGDLVEAHRDDGGGGTKNRSWWQLAMVWGPAARGGYYWLRFLESPEVVCVPASRIRLTDLNPTCQIRDVELEAILMHVGGERSSDAARRIREEDDDDDDDDDRSVSSSVGSNGGSSSEPESECSRYSPDGSKQRAETAYCLQRAAYMSGMIEMSG